MQSSYLTSAAASGALPEFDVPEVAFIGRSNSGKSSLLNSLIGRKNLSRCSAMPGRTQMANFFAVEPGQGERVIFVDLPGYGFSKAGAKVSEGWHDLVEAYLERRNVRDFLVLFDIRRDFDFTDMDLLMSLENRIAPTIVFTKTDKLSKSQCAQRKAQLLKKLTDLKIQANGIFLISNLNRDGIEELKRFLQVNTAARSSLQ